MRRLKSKRSGVLYLAHPVAPDAPKGTCRWCGSELVGARKDIRRYCYPDREGRDCAKEFRNSMTWDARSALRMLAFKQGETELRCVDCGVVVEKIHRGRIARVIYVEWEADHEIPLWEDGDHAVENLRVRCVPHHRDKTSQEATRRARLSRDG